MAEYGKLTPNICAPGSMKMPQGGQTDGVKKGSHARGGSLAKPGRSVGTGNPLGHMPVRKPTGGIANTKVGQANPNTSAAATKKPNRKGGAAFYGES